MEGEPKWTVVLSCYQCRQNFIVSHVSIECVKMLPGACSCSNCGAKPIVRGAAEFRVHRLVDFTDAMETVYRMRPGAPTWHFVSECSFWPSDNFIELNVRPKLGEMCRECFFRMHREGLSAT
jgi:hypothetical protein